MAEVNRIQELVQRLRVQRASPEALDRALNEVDRSQLREHELKFWYEQWGSVAEQQGQLERAAQRYEEGLARFPSHGALGVLLRRLRARDRVLARVEQLERQHGRYVPEAVEAALRAMPRADLRPDEIVTWHKEWAAAAMHQDHRDEALARYRAGVAEFPSSGVLRFGLGQELEFRGEADAAFSEFAHATFPNVPAEFLLLMAQYSLLWGRPAEGFRLLSPLLDAVLMFGEVDSHFLYVRGLPAAPRVARFAVAVAHQTGGDAVARLQKYMTRHYPVFQRAGIHELEAELHAAGTRDFKPLIAVLQQELTRASNRDIAGVQLRLFAAQAANGIAGAGDTLLSMLGGSSVFQRVMAASSCHRNGDAAGESRWLAELSAEDIMLLQASDVVAFSLLDYHERLRAPYVALRLGQARGGLLGWLRNRLT